MPTSRWRSRPPPIRRLTLIIPTMVPSAAMCGSGPLIITHWRALGNYYFTTALHELGHAFGLKHSQELGGVANVALPAAHDDSEFTVMSYRSYVGGPLTGYTNEVLWLSSNLYGERYPRAADALWREFTTHRKHRLRLEPDHRAEIHQRRRRNLRRAVVPAVRQTASLRPSGTATGRYLRPVELHDGVTINLNPGASSISSSTQFAYLGDGHMRRAISTTPICTTTMRDPISTTLLAAPATIRLLEMRSPIRLPAARVWTH